MSISNFIGWDIGGAHLKIANINKQGEILQVEQFPTPLWKGLSSLEDTIKFFKKKLPKQSLAHLLTMTGELVDIFEDRSDGVKSLISLCHNILGENIYFYSINKGFDKIDKNKLETSEIASANWHASSSYVSSFLNSGIFIDIGSTTTDIIPFNNHNICPQGINDQTRLCFDELVYTGVIRTPLMAITKKIIFNEKLQNIVCENFATTADIYRILGYLKNTDDLTETADSKDKSMSSCIRRLARMVGTDSSLFHNQNYWSSLARNFHEIQLEILTNAAQRVLSNIPNKENKIVGAGVGAFLAKMIAERLSIPYIEFSDLFVCNDDSKNKSNVCASAVAIAQLYRLLEIK